MTVDEMIAKKKEYGFSYEYIALKSGVPVSTVQKVLARKTHAPRYATLAALNKAFQHVGDDSSSKDITHLQEETPPEEMASPAPDHSLYSTEKKTGLIRESAAPYYAVSGTSALGRSDPAGKTMEDYLALPEGTRVELVDGEFYDLASPTSIHQILCTGLWYDFAAFIDSNGGDCVPLVAPMDVQLDCDDRTMVQPDVLVVCDRNKITKERIVGAPDLVVEILSPSTWYHDAIRKLLKYKKAGVREYWIVMPHNQQVLAYWFQESDLPVEYSFKDTVPVHIWEGRCKVDFKKLYDRISFLL